MGRTHSRCDLSHDTVTILKLSCKRLLKILVGGSLIPARLKKLGSSQIFLTWAGLTKGDFLVLSSVELRWVCNFDFTVLGFIVQVALLLTSLVLGFTVLLLTCCF